MTAWIDRAVRRLCYAGSRVCVVDGQPPATRWSAANTPRLVLPASLTQLVYYSRTEGYDVVPRSCGGADPDSRGCRDFIPPRSHYSFQTP